MEHWISEREFALMMGNSPSTTRFWRDTGKAPKFYAVGKKGIYYTPEDIAVWYAISGRQSDKLEDWLSSFEEAVA